MDLPDTLTALRMASKKQKVRSSPADPPKAGWSSRSERPPSTSKAAQENPSLRFVKSDLGGPYVKDTRSPEPIRVRRWGVKGTAPDAELQGLQDAACPGSLPAIYTLRLCRKTR